MEREEGRGRERLGHGGTVRARPYSGQARDKKGSGPKKLIFDFSKGFCIEP
jgi:hypothetical protein